MRAAEPTAQMILATPGVLAPVVDLIEAVDVLLSADEMSPPQWCGPPPQLAVNMHGRGPQSHRLLAALHPETLLGFANTGAGVEGPQWRDREHEVDRWCRLVREGTGVLTDPDDLLLPRPSAPPLAGAIVIHPGAAYPSRRWPADRFGKIAQWASRQGFGVLVTGSASERELAGEVCRLGALPAEANLAGTTDLAGLCGLVAHAPLVVCGDTGVAHLATAFATASVVIFGPVSPELWGPRSTGPHTVLWKGPHVGNPWGDTPDEALMQVTVGEVTTAADRLLRTPA